MGSTRPSSNQNHRDKRRRCLVIDPDRTNVRFKLLCILFYLPDVDVKSALEQYVDHKDGDVPLREGVSVDRLPAAPVSAGWQHSAGQRTGTSTALRTVPKTGNIRKGCRVPRCGGFGLTRDACVRTWPTEERDKTWLSASWTKRRRRQLGRQEDMGTQSQSRLRCPWSTTPNDVAVTLELADSGTPRLQAPGKPESSKACPGQTLEVSAQEGDHLDSDVDMDATEGTVKRPLETQVSHEIDHSYELLRRMLERRNTAMTKTGRYDFRSSDTPEGMSSKDPGSRRLSLLVLCSGMWAARVAVCLLTLSPPPRWAHRKGAPVTTCSEMEPRHDSQLVMHSHHYYQMVVDRLQGEQLRVTLMALNNQTSFKGFLIRAMRVQGSSLAYHGGRFEKDAAYPNVQFIACDGIENNAATHVAPNEKRQISVTWRPRDRSPDIVPVFFRRARIPDSKIVSLLCRATVVQNYATFWMKLDTERILIVSWESKKRYIAPQSAQDITTPISDWNDYIVNLIVGHINERFGHLLADMNKHRGLTLAKLELCSQASHPGASS
ncbi:hypothetical protein HPB47_024270 [Ixodes persulcatus]|uniref:Uncharacterized protein n=1 Tax=Ixodes persulcatus TaxID=34615 RepID=A0AC60Q6W0_IXOPE|nr:hypothetical protein HPB47_024270 [Ixodes persulcatus]